MLKRIILYALAAVLGCLASCGDDGDLPENGVIDISAHIIQPQGARVQIAEGGNGKFTPSDRITLWIAPEGGGSSKHELTCTGNGWTPRLAWSAVGGGKALFVAVYPTVDAAADDDGTVVHEVAADQRTAGAQQASDLLIAQTAARRGERVRLDFRHRMSRIAVCLDSRNGAFTPQELASATVRVRTRRQIAFNPHTAELGAVRGDTGSVTFRHVSGSTFHAVVCPQPIAPAWRNDGWIEIAVGKRRFVYRAPELLNGNIPFEKLEAGRQVTFNLTLDKAEAGGDGAETDWRNRTSWVYGIKNIPPLNQWGYYLYPKFVNGKPVNEIFALEWKREYGWYDCNKLNPTGPEYGDQNLCWAATCSNMIYWWLEHNANYIKRYGYKGPVKYVSDKDCEVFKFFKDNFTDSGLHINIGLDWFFRGSAVPSGNNARPTKHHPGFFKDVLTAPVTETVSRGGYGLSNALKKAFTERKAIGMSVLLNKASAAHAITIWGAGFDENGEVNVLYVVENNDVWANEYSWPMAPGKLGNAGIFTKKVKIDAAGKAFIEGGNPGVCSIEIDYLTLLPLHTEEWEAYFNKAGKAVR